MRLRNVSGVTPFVVCIALIVGACTTIDSTPAFDTDEHMSAWVNLWNAYDLSMVDDVHTATHGRPFTFVYVLMDAEYRLAHLNFGTYLETPDGEGG